MMSWEGRGEEGGSGGWKLAIVGRYFSFFPFTSTSTVYNMLCIRGHSDQEFTRQAVCSSMINIYIVILEPIVLRV